jgi:beta-phosphoglucomutase-like phosphatase (HAD superfamily)
MVTALGLPESIRVCLFDLDGVITRTALVHAKAWKDTFDSYLRARSAETGEPFVEFDAGEDYNLHVDGKPRATGVRDFLASRGITLPEGTHDDPVDAQTVNGVGNLKNAAVQRRIHEDGVEVYDGSVRYVRTAIDAGLQTAVVSSSANTREVLTVTGLLDLFPVIVDGVTARRDGLTGKPAPTPFSPAPSSAARRPPRRRCSRTQSRECKQGGPVTSVTSSVSTGWVKPRH